MGGAVRVGRDPFTGRFTPDGKSYLTLEWGRNLTAPNLEGRLPTRPSRLGVIRLDSAGGHIWRRGPETDRSSEGIAVSPDGRFVATVNMRDTPVADDSPRKDRFASVSLFTFARGSAGLTKVAEERFEAVLPEGATFDAKGERLLVTVYAYADRAGDGVEVWDVCSGDRPGLVRIGRVATPQGAHHVAVSSLARRAHRSRARSLRKAQRSPGR